MHNKDILFNTSIADIKAITLDLDDTLWPVPNPPVGVIDHMAFTAKDLKAVKSVFDVSGYPYKLQHPPNGPWQIFCEDPSGAKVELNFSFQEIVD